MSDQRDPAFDRPPEWVAHTVFYQIFPDRFARSPRNPLPRGIHLKPWGTPPEEQGFQGGDLYGIVDRLDYLSELGINGIYLNPIFASAANHRYHTYDYLQVDPLLGGNQAFRELLDAAHERGIRVIIDGVFNHASRGFWAFHHILENGPDSPYLDWFIVHGWPLHAYCHDEDHPLNYAAWWGLPALPKFNIQNPGVRDYLLHVSRHWMAFGADGWRLDVPEEIDDVAFWQEFRRVVRDANPEAYTVGEIWGAATEWLQGDRFDGAMNYIFSRIALGFFGAKTLRTDYKPGGYALHRLDAAAFNQAVHEMLTLYDWPFLLAQLNMLDSHDTARVLWTVRDDESALRLCVLFQMTMPGAPCIYYGDEIGMTGGPDPGCRGAFPWHDQWVWNYDLLDFYKRAIRLRYRFTALRIGDFQALYAQKGVYAYARAWQDERLLVAFNTWRRTVRVDIPLEKLLGPKGHFQAVWGDGEYTAQDGILRDVRISPRSGLVLQRIKV